MLDVFELKTKSLTTLNDILVQLAGSDTQAVLKLGDYLTLVMQAIIEQGIDATYLWGKLGHLGNDLMKYALS